MAHQPLKKIRLFLTGGHFAPASAVISELLKTKGQWEIFYLGRKYSMEQDKALALEYQELGNLSDLRYLGVFTGRLQRRFFVNIGQSIKALLKIPVGFLQSFWWLVRYRPRVVVSFGGYVALPVVLGARLLSIPVLTHEQTKSPGLSNRIIRLLGAKVLATGNPIRAEVLKAKPSDSNLIYITGGNQGSHVINLAVFAIISDLTKKYRVIHQTGDSFHHDFDQAPKIKNYEVRKFLSARESARVLASAHIIVSRAGANTLEEIAFLGKPAVLIPIPWASGREQEKNAQALVSLGMAELLPQDELTGKSLQATIAKIEKNYPGYLANAQKGKTLVHPQAAQKIVAAIVKELERHD